VSAEEIFDQLLEVSLLLRPTWTARWLRWA
jgi:hypothetical protein